MEIGHHMQPLRQRRREGDGGRQPLQLRIQPLIDRLARRARLLQHDRIGGMGRHHMIDEAAGGRLPALAEPKAGDHRRVIRPPDARHEARLGGHRHVTTRRAADERQTAEKPGRIRPRVAHRRADHADAAGMSVDRRGADRNAGCQPKLFRRSRRKTTHDRAERPDVRADAREALIGEVAQTDAPEIALIPALLMAEIGPFADGRAEGTREAARRPPGQEIRQIEEMRCLRPGLRAVLLQPEQLRRLHLQ